MSEYKFAKEKTAIVLIEPQNDFLSEGGTMYAYIKEQLAEVGVNFTAETTENELCDLYLHHIGG